MWTTLRLLAAAIGVAVAITGCGSTATLRQGKEIADGGKAFADSMQTIGDLAAEKVIDRSANGLGKRRETEWGRFDTSTGLADSLRLDRDAAALEISKIALTKQHSAKLEAYFDALAALVADPTKDTYAAATQELANSAEALATTLQSRNIVTSGHLATAQKEAIGAIGGVVGQWMQAQRVRDVLVRDGQVIDDQLRIERAILERYGDLIGAVDILGADQFYRENVRDPFVDKYPAPTPAGQPRPKAPALPTAWRANYGTDVKRQMLAAQVENAKKAVDKLRKAWRDYATGKQTMADVAGDWALIRDSLKEVQKLHENR